MERRTLLGGLVVAVGCAMLGCGTPVVIVHDEQAAAASATSFGDLAFVKGDVAGAYAGLSAPSQEAFPEATIVEEVTKLHRNGNPESVTATHYQPIPGQPAMSIALEGHRGDQVFLYRLLMVGDATAGYRVNGFTRVTDPKVFANWVRLGPPR